jgi:outer membrane protein TolC
MKPVNERAVLKINRDLLVKIWAILALVGLSSTARAQQPDAPAPQPDAVIASPAPVQVAVSSQAAQPAAQGVTPVALTLQDALNRARGNSVMFQTAVSDANVAKQDRYQAAAGMLPSVTYINQAIYSQSHGFGPNELPLFIANNGPHEYVSQADIHEVFDLAAFSTFRKSMALTAAARARAEVASRGLVVTVVQNYYAVAAAQHKLESAQRNASEGDQFFNTTKNLEQGGEVAHSDVIKAELQGQERHRQLMEAQLGLLNARLNLAVLVFKDFNDNFVIADDLHASPPLPPLEEVQQRATRDNPDLRVATESLKAAKRDVNTAWFGYFPSLTADFLYGIDAPRFARRSNGINNVGSAFTVGVVTPIWNWGITQSKVKQAGYRRNLSELQFTLAQRTLLSQIRSVYAEAETALNELTGLQRAAELSAESLRLITLRYKDGESTVLEVVDAQNTFALANAAYQDGAVRYRVALANLQTLTGVLTTP